MLNLLAEHISIKLTHRQCPMFIPLCWVPRRFVIEWVLWCEWRGIKDFIVYLRYPSGTNLRHCTPRTLCVFTSDKKNIYFLCWITFNEKISEIVIYRNTFWNTTYLIVTIGIDDIFSWDIIMQQHLKYNVSQWLIVICMTD